MVIAGFLGIWILGHNCIFYKNWLDPDLKFLGMFQNLDVWCKIDHLYNKIDHYI